MNTTALDEARAAAMGTRTEPITDAEVENAVAIARENIEGGDVIDDLFSAEDVFLAALRTGDARMVGRVVLAVFDAMAKRLAMRSLYGDARNCPSAVQAASAAVLGMSR